MKTKRLAICDNQERPLTLLVTTGHVSDHIGARALVDSLPKVDWLLGDRGYDADWFREALQDKDTPLHTGPNETQCDKCRYRRRNRPSRDFAAQCTVGQ